jgi:hypothetical protein
VNREIDRDERVAWAQAQTQSPLREGSALAEGSAEGSARGGDDGQRALASGSEGDEQRRNSVAFPSSDDPFFLSAPLGSSGSESSRGSHGADEYSDVLRSEMEAQEFGISPARQRSGDASGPAEKGFAFEGLSESIRGLLSPLLGGGDADGSSGRPSPASPSKIFSTELGGDDDLA